MVTSTGGGAGAVVRPVVSNGQVIDAIVINSGIGYSSVSTEARGFSRGTNGSYSARVRSFNFKQYLRFVIHFIYKR